MTKVNALPGSIGWQNQALNQRASEQDLFFRN